MLEQERERGHGWSCPPASIPVNRRESEAVAGPVHQPPVQVVKPEAALPCGQVQAAVPLHSEDQGHYYTVGWVDFVFKSICKLFEVPLVQAAVTLHMERTRTLLHNRVGRFLF